MNGGEGVKPLPAFQGVKLYIGIPTRGTCTTHFATSLAVSHAALTKAGVDVQIHQSQMSCFVDMSRNTLVAEFLKTDCTHMWQIDDDMGWNADAILHMLAQDREFVAAAGPKKVDSGDQFCCTIHVHADETPIVDRGLISASKVGAAFVLFKRSAIERMIKAYPEMVCRAVDKEFGYRFYETEYSENKFQSEDYTFCDRFTAAGGEIWIYPNVDFVHTGPKDFRGNYHKFLLGMPQAEPKTVSEGLSHSLVIVAYKAAEALNRCLASLAENPAPNAELILIDNSPEAVAIAPEILGALDAKYSRVLIQHDGQNLGFAEACNVGARQAKGHNLIFINPDTVVYPGWCEAMSAQLRSGVGAVGPLSNFVCGAQNWVCYAHSAKLAKEDATPEYCRLVAHGVKAAKIHAGIESKLLIGFFLMVPRAVWYDVGEFDPAFVLGCDDLDYSMRLRGKGYKLIIAPDAFVYHEGHASFREEGDPALEMNRVSEAHMRLKLTELYGERIPTSTEIWGCEIFSTGPESVPTKEAA
jgi:GT2 family glycosyltransferase